MNPRTTNCAYAADPDLDPEPTTSILSERLGPFIVNQRIGKRGPIDWTLLQIDGLPLFRITKALGKKYYQAAFLEGYSKKDMTHERVMHFVKGKFGKSVKLI